MSIIKEEKDKILRLRNEGKMCSEIWSEDFPHLGYWEIMGVIYGAGVRTAIGTKSAIARRCKKIREAVTDDRIKKLVKEIDDLAWQLYKMIKDNQKRLDEIRKLTTLQSREH